MISVTIEYFIKSGQEAQYETLADRIHPEVYSVDGFISVEGYESRSEPGKWLSLSLWRDEDAVRANGSDGGVGQGIAVGGVGGDELVGEGGAV